MVLLSSSAFDDPRLLPFVLGHAGKPPEQLQVAVVVSASPLKATGPNAIKTMDYLTGHGVANSQFVDLADGQPAKDALSDADVVLFNGGNPFLLFSAVQKQDYWGELESLAGSDKLVIGVSAGGMLFSPGLHLLEDFNRILGFVDKGNTEGITDLEGLNLFDEVFFPHYDAFCQRAADLPTQLTALEEQHGCRLYRQNNGRTAMVRERRIVDLV